MLGNFNGDPDDDLAPPTVGNASAVPISSTSSLSAIHYNFGMLWLLPSTNALFRNGYNQTAIDIWTPAFENDFGDCPDGMEAAAEALCGGVAECMYDAAATCDLFVANLTVEFEKEYIARNISNDTMVTLPPTTTTTTTTIPSTTTSTAATTSTSITASTTTEWWVWLIVALAVVVVIVAVAVVVVCMNKDKQAVEDNTKQHTQASSSASKEPPAGEGNSAAANEMEAGGKAASTNDGAAEQGSTAAPPIPKSSGEDANNAGAF